MLADMIKEEIESGCEFKELLEASRLINTALRQHAKAAIAELDKQRAELESIMSGDAAPEKRTATPKYRDPDTGNTWTGRGKRPSWMNGGDPEQYRIAA